MSRNLLYAILVVLAVVVLVILLVEHVKVH